MTADTQTLKDRKPWLTVIGLSLEGAEALGPRAKAILQSATHLHASERQLDLIPVSFTPEATRTTWPSPMMPAVAELLTKKPERTVILASGDPLCWGIGQYLVAHLGPEELNIIPAVSIITLISAAMGWPSAEVKSLSLCSQPLSSLAAELEPGAKLILLPSTLDDIKEVGHSLTSKGFGNSATTLLENLGSTDEKKSTLKARDLDEIEEAADLTSLAIDLIIDETTPRLSQLPGLPDETFEHDGQITRRHMRAITLSHLRPTTGDLLWDIGAGSGSISIEWCRAANRTRAIAIEQNNTRSTRLQRNAETLGVTKQIEIIEGSAPTALEELEAPDAIFIGGGVTAPTLLEMAIERLKPAGRLVANTVTIEGEALLIGAYIKHGGSLTRLSEEKADPIGRFNGWRPKMPITQWIFQKP